MTLRNTIVTATPPHRHLASLLPQLRSLRSSLSSVNTNSSLAAVVALFEVISRWEEPRLMSIIEEYDKLNFVGDFDEELDALRALQELFCDAAAHGIVVGVYLENEREGLVLSTELRDKIVATIGNVEFLVSKRTV